MLPFKQVESNYSESPANKVAVRLLSFPILWISDTVNMVLLFFQFELKMAVHATCTKTKNYVKWTTFNTFLRKVNFIYNFASLLSAWKPFSGNLEG